MAIIESPNQEPMIGDPDDHRPNTTWAIVVDPSRDDGAYVQDITMVFERIAPGDRIPIHTHSTSEAVVIDEGRGVYALGDEVRPVAAGACVFIPAGTPHGTHNETGEILALHAMYPSPTIDITYLERNPAPGTEGEPPQPPLVVDPRST